MGTLDATITQSPAPFQPYQQEMLDRLMGISGDMIANAPELETYVRGTKNPQTGKYEGGLIPDFLSQLDQATTTLTSPGSQIGIAPVSSFFSGGGQPTQGPAIMSTSPRAKDIYQADVDNALSGLELNLENPPGFANQELWDDLSPTYSEHIKLPYTIPSQSAEMDIPWQQEVRDWLGMAALLPGASKGLTQLLGGLQDVPIVGDALSWVDNAIESIPGVGPAYEGVKDILGLGAEAGAPAAEAATQGAGLLSNTELANVAPTVMGTGAPAAEGISELLSGGGAGAGSLVPGASLPTNMLPTPAPATATTLPVDFGSTPPPAPTPAAPGDTGFSAGSLGAKALQVAGVAAGAYRAAQGFSDIAGGEVGSGVPKAVGGTMTAIGAATGNPVLAVVGAGFDLLTGAIRGQRTNYTAMTLSEHAAQDLVASKGKFATTQEWVRSYIDRFGDTRNLEQDFSGPIEVKEYDLSGPGGEGGLGMRPMRLGDDRYSTSLDEFYNPGESKDPVIRHLYGYAPEFRGTDEQRWIAERLDPWRVYWTELSPNSSGAQPGQGAPADLLAGDTAIKEVEGYIKGKYSEGGPGDKDIFPVGWEWNAETDQLQYTAHSRQNIY